MRLFALRRTTQVTALTLVAIIAALIWFAYAASDNSAEATTKAQTRATQSRERCVAEMERFRTAGISRTDTCDEIPTDLAGFAFWRDSVSYVFGLAVVLCLSTLIMASAFAGREWRDHSVGFWVLVEGRTTRLAGRTIGAALGGLAIFVLAQALLLLGLCMVAIRRGNFVVDKVTPSQLSSVIFFGAIFVIAAAVLGVSLTNITRNSSTAIAGLLLYLLAAEPIIQSVDFNSTSWTVRGAFYTFVRGRVNGSLPQQLGLQSGRYLGTMAMLLIAPTAIAFLTSRRDDIFT